LAEADRSGVDLAPSMHWPAPIVAQDVKLDPGPVLVTVEYRIDPRDASRFSPRSKI
jgi:hypothetical protein